jgi:hypothetical protein
VTRGPEADYELPMAPALSGPPERIQLVIDSFPAQLARTQQFTLGLPRSYQIVPDGSRVAFLRSRGGADPLTCLWVLDVADGRERLGRRPGRDRRSRRAGAGREGAPGAVARAGIRHRLVRD